MIAVKFEDGRHSIGQWYQRLCMSKLVIRHIQNRLELKMKMKMKKKKKKRDGFGEMERYYGVGLITLVVGKVRRLICT